MSVKFFYNDPFPIGKDDTQYRLLTSDYITKCTFEGKTIVKVSPEALTLLTKQAFEDTSYLLRTEHLKQLASIVQDNNAGENDRYVAIEFLKNAAISAEREFPMCQDTGTAIIIGKKGQQIWTDTDSDEKNSDEKAISLGVYKAYTENNLRYSQNVPLDMYEEQNSDCNLPAQIEIYATSGDKYAFLFIAKGGGSANKTFLFQETRALLSPEKLLNYLTEKMKTLGTAACPPYHLAFAIGGTSAEANLKAVKLASAKYLDKLPTSGNEYGQAFRDIELENKLLENSRKIGLGAQFGGKYFCHDIRVIRLPRHGASCPIGIGLSCSGDRNIKGFINADGIYLEKLDTNPARFLPNTSENKPESVSIDLNKPMDSIRADLTKYPIGTRVMLNGKIIVARDIAHARLKERLDKGDGLPQYLKDHIVYYAGPAKTPKGYACGSFGPTTAGRMDSYVDEFQKQKASLVMLAKGNRSDKVTEACKKYGGFYLSCIGGAAAVVGKEYITDMKLLEYPELGMEAIYEITVANFPAFIIVDDKGNNFFDKK